MTSPPLPVEKSVMTNGSGLMATSLPSGCLTLWAPTSNFLYCEVVRTIVSTPAPVLIEVEKDPETVIRSFPSPPSTVTEL